MSTNDPTDQHDQPDQPDRYITAFACGPSPTASHKCDHDGPSVPIHFGDRTSGESSSCSVCGSTSFDRSFWSFEEVGT